MPIKEAINRYPDGSPIMEGDRVIGVMSDHPATVIKVYSDRRGVVVNFNPPTDMGYPSNIEGKVYPNTWFYHPDEITKCP